MMKVNLQNSQLNQQFPKHCACHSPWDDLVACAKRLTIVGTAVQLSVFPSMISAANAILMPVRARDTTVNVSAELVLKMRAC